MSVVRLTHFTDPHLYGSEAEALRGVPHHVYEAARADRFVLHG